MGDVKNSKAALAVEEGWAIRIRPGSSSYRAWLNHGGGYSTMRRDRKVWQTYDEALDVSHEWDSNNPVIVRILFKVRHV